MAPTCVSIPYCGDDCELHCDVAASSERLRMAATVRSAGSSVAVGAIVIISATAIAALAFTRRRSRARLRKLQEIRLGQRAE